MPTIVQSDGPANRCFFSFEWVSKYACSQCRSNQVETITGRCVEKKKRKRVRPSAQKWIKEKINTEGERKIARMPKAGEYCALLDSSKEMRDGSPLKVYQQDSIWNYYSYVDNEVEIESCDLLDEMVNSSPMVQFFSMLAAVVASLLGVCALLICCSYCQLQRTYGELEKSVQGATREVGLPDDYEYDEDNIYM